jgi:hypothetical protein
MPLIEGHAPKVLMRARRDQATKIFNPEKPPILTSSTPQPFDFLIMRFHHKNNSIIGKDKP